ncbi:hypothetical protein B0J13DRAFT_69080 [Dactylonectria estremocensis]|uniref:Zn(2)-C6 fungal-type domain-containing protein n=1 Tax=Dactylonectria estremocensis TaxID=1079267 RepID=A0A9P9ELZ9_9HYPO|nr:hypothetical protein B0J13DRAFT_69080 [Dactylonectria estremocensis]
MFPCPHCSKEFTIQGSLARHLQNHSQTAKHVCHVCNVIFRRRDLLTRHMKLHDPGAGADGSVADQESSAGDSTAASRGPHQDVTEKVSRKRCHTACNRCRDLKIKCDGQYPCTRCCNSGKACEFDRLSSRISHIPMMTDDTSFSAESGSVSTDVTAQPSLPSFSPDINDIALSAEEPSIVGRGGAVLPFSAPMLTWDSTFCELAPWPWLHESIFLSGDQSGALDGPVAPNLAFAGDLFSELPLAILDEPAHHADNPPAEISGRLGTPSSTAAGIAVGSTTTTNPVAVASASTPRLAVQAAGAAPAPLSPPVENSGNAPSPEADAAIAASLKRRAVDDLIALAVQGPSGGEGGAYIRPSELWARTPSDLVTAFSLGSDLGASNNATTLEHLVKLYKEHFHQLWPLLPRRNLNTGDMHPLLYLTLASIGAMYMGPSGSECGAFLHNAVRKRVALPVELDETDDNLVWLAQSRLLTQVAALYFGQPRAFSYAQYLGGLLTAQARRMCLFSSTYHRQRVDHFKRVKGVISDAERLGLWFAIEERRRLAFGIFRGDTFTSVLLNTKPLVTLDEIDLEFPSCNAVYNGEALDPRLALEMLQHDRTLSQDLRASDVYHILLERNEMLPPLEPIAHEILLFGLQLFVWRFSRDRQLLEGFTGGRGFEEGPDAETNGAVEDDSHPPSKKRRRDTSTSEVDSLDNRSYQMTDLVNERRRLAAALAKWERALPLAKTFARTEEDRSYVLSSLILYHLSLLRLYAPVEDIHQIHYRLADHRPVSPDLVAGIQAWTQTPKARIAVDRVRSVWSLITQQTQLGCARSRFNFNAYVGLHHGAAILWAYNGGRSHQTGVNSVSTPSQGTGSSPTFSLHADRAESKEILKTFVNLFKLISPAQWSSFAEVTDTLCTLDFPTRPEQI